eukprot:TRINITY_DN18052_c0_g1_i1.p1 TRINITY_DN18052_c0_g1~~TRINITY_DN18052_c0_g1_i1.p1  ORF type:complete len:1424 (-),score=349.46 TRINITY_DN18052_c0_g1_i1:31-4302(-)
MNPEEEKSPIKRVSKTNYIEASSVEYGAVSSDTHLFFEGIGKKDGGNVKSWKKRWFVLTHRHLLYFPTDGQEPDKRALPKGIIPLETIKNPVEIVQLPASHKLVKQFKGSRYPICLELPLSGQRSLHIRVGSQSDCNAWIKQLRNNTIKTHETPMLEEKHIRSDNFHAKKYVWFEDIEGYLALLQDLQKSKPAERKLLQRNESLMYKTNLHQKIWAETMEIRKIIEKISDNMTLFDCIRLLVSCKKNERESELITTLLPEFKMPYEMVHLGNKDTEMIDLGIAKPLEDLVEEIRRVSKLIPNETVIKHLQSIISYYTDEIERINSFGTRAIMFPVIVEGDGLNGKRTLNKKAAQAILREGRDNKYGLHSVIAYSDIHWKKSPGSPGYEYAVDCFNKLVSGEGSAPARLFKITKTLPDGKSESTCFLGSKTVDGPLLKSIVEEKPEILYHLDTGNFTSLFLMSLLTDIQDGKADNYIGIFNSNTKKIEIVCIDNDHAFSDTIVGIKTGHSLNVRNIFYLFPHTQRLLDPKSKAKFASHSPFLLVMTWLEHLHKKNKEYDNMKNEAILTHLDCVQMNLPIKIRPGEVLRLYRKLVILKEAFNLDEKNLLTHSDILRIIQPEVHAVTKQLLQTTKTDRPDFGHTAFRRLFKMPLIEEDPNLIALLDEVITFPEQPPQTLRAVLSNLPKPVPDVHSYVKMRSLTVPMAMQELLSEVHFESLSKGGQAEQNLLYDQIFPIVSFLGDFIINASNKFTTKELHTLAKNSPKLEKLYISHCNNLPPEAFQIFLQDEVKQKRSYLPISIFIDNCNLLTNESIQDLVTKGLRIQFGPPPPKIDTTYDPATKIAGLKQYLKFPTEVISISSLFVEGKVQEAVKILMQHPEIIQQTKSRNLILQRAEAYDALHVAVSLGSLDIVEWLIYVGKLDINAWGLTTETPLQIAAKQGNIEMCKKLVSLGANPKGIGKYGWCPLRQAIFSGEEGAAYFLLQQHTKDEVPLILTPVVDKFEEGERQEGIKDSYNLAHIAVSRGLMGITAELINNFGIDVNATTGTLKKNLLHIAGEHNIRNIELLKFLIEKNINIHCLSYSDCSPLLSSAKGGNCVLAEILLAQTGDSLSYACATNKEEQNLCHLVTQYLISKPSHVSDYLTLMLSKFPDLIEKRDFLRRTPLAYAAKFGNFDAMTILLLNGANPNVIDTTGNTPLHYVVELENEDNAKACLKLLLNARTLSSKQTLTASSSPEKDLFQDILEARNSVGVTPLGRAILLMYRKPALRQALADDLINAGSDIDKSFKSPVGASILHQAIHRGAIEPVLYLLEHKQKLNCTDTYGNTPLHEACTLGHLQIVQELCKAIIQDFSKPDQITYLNSKNMDGDTPMLLAVKSPRNQSEIIKELIQHGASLLEENIKGETVQLVAKRLDLKIVLQLFT